MSTQIFSAATSLCLVVLGLAFGAASIYWCAWSVPVHEQLAIVGGIDFCDKGPQTPKDDYACASSASFSCRNVCDPCTTKTTSTACAAATCWRCTASASLTECYVLLNFTCVDFGSIVTPCGSEEAAQCSWDASDSSCYCDYDNFSTGGACRRSDCSM